MPEITQKLGFEATQAIATLDSLSGSIGKVNRKLTTYNKLANTTSNAAANGFTNLASKAKQAQTALTGTTSAAKATGAAGTKAATNITVSWETMVRVIQTQVLLRAFGLIRRAFNDTADAAEEFQLAIGRSAAIAQGPAGEFDSLSSSVRELAVELGRPVADIAGASYEALQNDLGSVAETMKFVEGAANDLSLVTGGSLLDSVNTLSSVLKIFKIDIEDADSVADTLFGTVDSGRVTLDDLASSLGGVGPFAAQLGVSLEQFAASLAAITLQGVDSAKAQTQLKGIFNALLKPTTALKEAYEELGVASGKELITSTGGLVEALQALEEVAGGNEAVFAAFFGRIRGQSGALNILNDEASNAIRILGELESGMKDVSKEGDVIDNLDARKSQRAFAKLSDTMLDLGENTQRVRTFAVESLNSFVSSGGQARIALTSVGVGLTALVTQLAVVKIAVLAAFAPLVPVLALVAAAIASGFAIAKIVEWSGALTQAIDDIKAVGDAANAELAAKFDLAFAKIDKSARDSFESRKKFSKEWVKASNKDYSAVIGQGREANSVIVGNAKVALDRFIEARKQSIAEIEKAIAGIDSRIADSTNRIKSAVSELDNFTFDRSIAGLNEQGKAAARLEQATRAAGDARKAAANAGISEQATADARALQGVAKKKAQQAVAAAEQSGNIVRIREANDQLQRVLEQNVKSEKQFRQNLQNFKKQALQEDLQAAKVRFDKEKELAENFVKLLEKVNSLTSSEAVKLIDLENLEETSSKLGELLKQDLNLDLFEQFDAQKFVDQTTSSFVQSMDSAQFQFDNVHSAVQASLDASPFRLTFEAGEAAGAATGNSAIDDAIQKGLDSSRGGGQAEGVADSLTQLLTAQEKLNASVNKQAQGYVNAKNIIDEIVASPIFRNSGTQLEALTRESDVQNLIKFRDLMGEISTTLPTATQDTSGIIQGKLDEGQAILRSLLESGALTEQQAIAGGEALKAGAEALASSLEKQTLESRILPESAKILIEERLASIQANVEKITSLPTEGALSKEMNDAADSSKQVAAGLTVAGDAAGTAKTNIGGMKTASDGTNSSVRTIVTSMGAVTSATGRSTQAMRQLEAQAKRAAAAAAAANGGGGQALYHGGKVNFRAQGGPITRGQDTQLTALSAGESVINAKTSRQFAPEIQAINAGQRPQVREQSGPVTNVGDINVSVSTDSTRGVSGRDIAVSLRRELRRNTSQI